MTTKVVTVAPDTPTPQIAQLLLEHGISAVPVVDSAGTAIGMVSEGDLIGRSDADRETRRDWWLSLVAEGESLNPDFLATVRRPELTARDVMSAPVIRITETTEAAEIAQLLATYRIKRVPVVRDGRVIGIVSRADLLRAFEAERAGQPSSDHVSRARQLLADALSSIDRHFLERRHTADAKATPVSSPPKAGDFSAADFRVLVSDFEHQKAKRRDEANRAAAEQRRLRVKEYIDHHVALDRWNAIIHQAREAAEHGETEIMVIRFPSDLCTDRGRAINSALPEWPKTLRGEAAELYLRWQRELKPRGFHLAARVLDFSEGKPGDAGLFLGWGG